MIQRFCVVGLGNPGASYRGTRHNIGFDWIDSVTSKLAIEKSGKVFESEWFLAREASVELHFLKPQTFMNLSGRAVRAWKDKYQGDCRMLVVLDDIDLAIGKLRLRKSGGDAGHRGLRSIQETLGTQDIPRLRIGVGRGEDAKEFVLERFKPDEKLVMGEILNAAPAHLSACIQATDWDAAMNTVNAWTPKAGSEK